jgi:hypothetical protein
MGGVKKRASFPGEKFGIEIGEETGRPRVVGEARVGDEANELSTEVISEVAQGIEPLETRISINNK